MLLWQEEQERILKGVDWLDQHKNLKELSFKELV